MEHAVLVVDDQADNIKTITSLLKEMGLGKKIYSAPNGKVGLHLAEKFVPDLILSDWEMPVMNGIDMVKALKQKETTKDIPVIMITAVKIDPVSMKESFDAGVHDYLKKPFNNLEFFARVSATLKLQSAYLTIKKSKDEIASQALLISKQNEQLKQLNKLKDNILSIISHDVRSPLASLDGLLMIFNNEDLELDKEELKKYVSLVQKELNNVMSFLDDLLFWAKSQIENTNVPKEEISIGSIVAKTFSLLQERANKKQLHLINKIDPSLTVYGDKDVLSFIIRNLFDNAIKFTPEGGTIEINSEHKNKSLTVSVTDTGVGMEAEMVKDFFENRGVSSLKGTSGELGTGLGLKLCKDFAEQHKGTLTIKSELGVGSVFSLTLPKNE